jgi:hypothetical protein
MNRLNGLDRCEDVYEKYYEWLDEYNSDTTQPPEIPSTYIILQQFPELGQFEAVQIVVNYMENRERQLKGG